MYQAERRKNEAIADRKASIIKDAVGVGIMLPNSHRKSHHAQVQNCKGISEHMLPCAY